MCGHLKPFILTKFAPSICITWQLYSNRYAFSKNSILTSTCCFFNLFEILKMHFDSLHIHLSIDKWPNWMKNLKSVKSNPQQYFHYTCSKKFFCHLPALMMDLFWREDLARHEIRQQTDVISIKKWRMDREIEKTNMMFTSTNIFSSSFYFVHLQTN